MTDPQRLLQSELNDELRSAFESSAVEPSAQELGLLSSKVSAALALPLAVPPALAATATSKILGLTSVQTTLPLWKLGAWVLGGVVLGVGLSGAVTAGLSATGNPTPPAPVAQRAPTPIPLATPAPAPVVELRSAASSEPPLATSARPAASVAVTGELILPREDELSLLHRAQESLRGNPARALELATRHEVEFPDGALAQEREVIELTALIRLRRLPEAEARAKQFGLKYPGSAHAVRIDRLLGEARSR